jgi:DNA repair protein RecO (recombination protein O)
LPWDGALPGDRGRSPYRRKRPSLTNFVITTAAILLRKIKLTESSLIVTWLTEDQGKLKTVARGARRPRSAFAGQLDLFFAADITFARSTKSDLHALREVSVRDPRDGLRQLYARTRLASYFVELLELSSEFEQPIPELYDLLRRALDYLNGAEPSRRALLHFEAELSRLLGLTGTHNADADPADAIARLAGRLPPGRAKLWQSLPAVPAMASPPKD